LANQTTKGSRLAALKLLSLKKAAVGIEPTNKGFADLCLTTWLRRRKAVLNDECGMMNATELVIHHSAFIISEAGDGI
jgi:hypothetical protein